MRDHFVLTAAGHDSPGLVENVTAVLLEFDGNVEASRMARLGGEFAMLMLVSAPSARMAPLREALADLEFEVYTRVAEAGQAPLETGFTPCGITVMGADHLGIVHEIAHYLAEHGVNVETMNTEVMAAPMSGSPLFTMTAVVAVPATLTIDELREAMERIAHDVGVEASVMAHR